MTPIILIHVYVNYIQSKAFPFTIVMGREREGGIQTAHTWISDHLAHDWNMYKVLFLNLSHSFYKPGEWFKPTCSKESQKIHSQGETREFILWRLRGNTELSPNIWRTIMGGNPDLFFCS